MWIRIRNSRLTVTVIVTALLGIFVALSITSMRTKSLTTDEITYISSGYYMLKTRDFTLNSGHPILVQLLMTSPLLLMDLKMPPHISPFFENTRYNFFKNWQYSIKFLNEFNCDKIDQIVFATRLAVLLMSIILALYVFLWSKELYGVPAGVFALFLFVFSPNIIAHSTLATTDLGFTAFAFVAVYYFRKFVINPNFKSLILAGVFLGLVLITKITALLLLPVYLLMLLLFLKERGLERSFLGDRVKKGFFGNFLFLVISFSVLTLVACFMINLCYGFQGSFEQLANYKITIAPRLIEKLSSVIGVSLKNIIGALPVPFPASFFETLIHLFKIKGGHATFLMGQHSVKGWWYYHLVAFFIKVPIPTLLFFIISIFSIVMYKGKRNSLSNEYMLIIPIFSILFIVSYGDIKIGLRHILPIFPFVFVLVSRLTTLKRFSNTSVRAALVVCCLWYMASSFSIYPHYLAYFNEFVGGPSRGYKYLLDSNLDWGQDLKGLKKYMTDQGISKIKLSYMGSADPACYGIDYEYLPSVGLRPSQPHAKWWYEDGYEEICEPTHGFVAISVNNLQGLQFKNKRCFQWLNGYTPVAKIGYSIFVYNVSP